MKLSALEYMCCLSCRSSLELEADEQLMRDNGVQEVISGRLKCTGCNRQYQIVRGIPRFTDEGLSSARNMETGQRFGMAWKEFPRLDARYEQQFFDWIYPIDCSFFKDKVVLEGGCGKGRHAQIVAHCGAKHVFAIDIGEAVDISFENIGHLENVHIIQCDICNLPFKPVFDLAFSLGVLHHMDVPRLGFLSLTNMLNSNGTMCAWVYGRENNWWLIYLLNPIRESFTSRLHAVPLKILSAILAIPVYLVAKFIARPYMYLKKKMNFLPPLFYSHYLSYIAMFDFNEIHHLVFDHLVAPVSNYLPKTEVESWFEEANFKDKIIRWHNRNSWSGSASGNETDMKKLKEKMALPRLK